MHTCRKGVPHGSGTEYKPWCPFAAHADLQLSFGPISWLIVGEVFPLAVRGQALAIATIINFGSNFGVSLVLPYAQVRPSF